MVRIRSGYKPFGLKEVVIFILILILPPLSTIVIMFIVNTFFPPPHAEIIDINLSKSEFSQTDEGTLFFRIKSNIKKDGFILTGLKVKIISSKELIPYFSTEPHEYAIEYLGPEGESKTYNFKLFFDKAPPGKYIIYIELYEGDNIIDQESKEIKIIAKE